MLTIISSQRYVNESIVLSKMKRNERWIHISPVFIHEGKLKAVLLDGHHSLEASKRLGKVPKVDIVDEEAGCEIELLHQNEVDWFLAWNQNDSEYYETYTLDGDFHPVNI
ncbi:hypothetical protein HUO09_17710 [Vibrio sp. Y2-5]|uniref:hypothetical protein n=1 Tax=Vibrio sp. Y2-5 TaxID=2743977 RepID=UPI0016614D30|nr:hypothetical protein [Vibrio sp. Y2-5]MBD0788195.1 hypothetical protein [Vibrio sp. Y2-5]